LAVIGRNKADIEATLNGFFCRRKAQAVIDKKKRLALDETADASLTSLVAMCWQGF